MDENKNLKLCTFKILLDSSASALIVHEDVLHEHHRILKDKKNKWSTIAGTFIVTELKLKTPGFNLPAEIYAKCHLTDKLLNCNFILGRDILHELGLIFYFKTKTIIWQEVSISMKPPNCMAKEIFVIKESFPVQNTNKRIKKILDVKYKKINLKTIVMSLNYLKINHKISFIRITSKIWKIFDGTLGKYTGSIYTIELKEDAKPHHAKLFPITNIHNPTLKEEVDRLIKVGVLKKLNNLQWAAPTLIIPKINA